MDENEYPKNLDAIVGAICIVLLILQFLLIYISILWAC